jgi:phage tail protein X
MTVRRLLLPTFASAMLLLGAGCGGGGNGPTADETSDSAYQQAQEFKKEGRNGEALSAFLKEIDRRGESGAPESHLEAGALYLNWAKDPVEAYHHFSKYLELQPTGPRADIVRGQRDAAKRELARILLAPPADQMVQLEHGDELEQLRRRVQELEAENQALRGGGGASMLASSAANRAPPMIALPDESATSAAPSNGGEESPITPATTPAPSSPFTRSLTPSHPATIVQQAPAAATRGGVAPTRPGAPTKPAATAGRRTHTVSQKDSLWGIARRYYGSSVNAAKVQGIYEANRDVMRSPSDLRAGMVLKIP